MPMKKTGKSAFILFGVFFVLAICNFRAFAQPSVTVNASVSETTVYTGERISLSVEVSGDFNNVSRPTLPRLQGFRLLSNNPSTSRNYSFVNGRSSSSYTYSYYLIAQNKGSYVIPSVSVEIDGKEYTTDPITVRIVDRNTSATNPSAQSRPGIFLMMEVSDKTPVTGQQLIADVVLYFKEGLEVSSYQPIPGWKAEGFWKEELENSHRPRAETVILDGVRYRKARLIQLALFPTKTGELTISPYEIVVSVRSAATRDDPFSSFFGGFGSNQRQAELKTDPLNVEVRPLPDLPDGRYTGAVGSFNISREVNTREALVGETIEIKTTVKGTGNIPLIGKPAYDLPDGLEVYAPQEASSLNRHNEQISGSKTFTDIIIPRSPGTFVIPEEKMAYFNPDQNRYVVETLPPVTFTVERDPNAIASSGQTISFSVQPITGLAAWVSPNSAEPWAYWWFWAGLVLPFIVLGIGYWQKTYQEKMHTDTGFARSRKAAQIAEERLNSAVQLSEQDHVKEAYNVLQKALTGFIGDRLGLPEAGLANQEYIAALDNKGVDPNLTKNVRMLLDKCSTISYAPDASQGYLKSHVELARSILDKLKKVL